MYVHFTILTKPMSSNCTNQIKTKQIKVQLQTTSITTLPWPTPKSLAKHYSKETVMET